VRPDIAARLELCMHRVVSFCAIGVALALAVALAQPRPGSATPNVVLIITDDVGYGDIGSYGAPDIRTPHIDRLAKEGVRLTDFYAAPSCTPTRAALMTGRYQQRVRLEQPLPSAPAGGQGLAPTGRSLPQLLKNTGYSTALFGKWHLGYRPEFQPNAHGFDQFFGFLSGFIDYYQHTGGDGKHDLYENGEPSHVTGYMTDLITDRSVAFIEKSAKQPFFLEVAYNAAHWPFQVPDKPSVAPGNARFVQPTDEPTSTRQEYAAILERADQGVGKILDALKRVGVERNTLVIFTNDNGGEWLSRNAPLFHRKLTVWEGGIRVPAIMRWPARLPAGRVSAQVGITMDLTATVLAAANASVPGDARLEGIDLLPILEGRSPVVERTLFFRTARQRAARMGDWKLLADSAAGAGGPWLLFNLRQDIGERNDLARTRPDLVRQIRARLDEWEADVNRETKGVN
jgi:arylsulfatase A-like enzyme